MNRFRKRRRGNTTIEFTLVGLPLVFVLISIFEISRGMWVYHTMAYALKEGTRYAVVHGQDCTAPLASGCMSSNCCQVTIAQVAQVIRDAGVGLDPSQLTLTFITGSNQAGVSYTLHDALNTTTVWPPYPDNQPGLPIAINGIIPFNSAIAMFWPGAGKGMTFGRVWFPASSQETMQF